MVMVKDKLVLLCLLSCCLKIIKGHDSKSGKSDFGTKTESVKGTKRGKGSKRSKQSKQDRYSYCEQVVGAGHYNCPLDSYIEADERVADEIVQLCETQHAVELVRSYIDGSQNHVTICPAELKYFNNGVEFDRGISKIYMINRRDGVCTLSGEPLKQPVGEACDINYDCGIGLVCETSHQCTDIGDEVYSESPSMDPSKTQTSPPFPIIVTETPTVQPTKTTGNITNQPSLAPSESPSGMPSLYPSHHPATISAAPSENPSIFPSNAPSFKPTNMITELPSNSPSSVPTLFSTTTPSQSPSNSPRKNPSSFPSVMISDAPSGSPSSIPTLIATTTPSQSSSKNPSALP